MGRSVKDLRRTIAPITGTPLLDDSALVRTAVPTGTPQPLGQEVKQRTQQLRYGYPKGPAR